MIFPSSLYNLMLSPPFSPFHSLIFFPSKLENNELCANTRINVMLLRNFSLYFLLYLFPIFPPPGPVRRGRWQMKIYTPVPGVPKDTSLLECAAPLLGGHAAGAPHWLTTHRGRSNSIEGENLVQLHKYAASGRVYGRFFFVCFSLRNLFVW